MAKNPDFGDFRIKKTGFWIDFWEFSAWFHLPFFGQKNSLSFAVQKMAKKGSKWGVGTKKTRFSLGRVGSVFKKPKTALFRGFWGFWGFLGFSGF
jgi:hypothetical protein